MNKNNKIRGCIRIYMREFFVFIHKKASFPSGCTRKLCHVVARLNRINQYALRLVPSGKSFFADNVIFITHNKGAL